MTDTIALLCCGAALAASFAMMCRAKCPHRHVDWLTLRCKRCGELREHLANIEWTTLDGEPVAVVFRNIVRRCCDK